jgi:hypothetical protein
MMNVSTMGLFCVVFLTVCWLKTKWHWLANIPGDFAITVGKCQVSLPVASCLITSVVVTLILAIVNKKP